MNRVYRSLNIAVLGSLAMIASVLLFSDTSWASSPRVYLMSIEHREIPPIPIVVIALDEIALPARPATEVSVVASARSSYPLTPEYAESYDTHGLNFIETRRRC